MNDQHNSRGRNANTDGDVDEQHEVPRVERANSEIEPAGPDDVERARSLAEHLDDHSIQADERHDTISSGRASSADDCDHDA